MDVMTAPELLDTEAVCQELQISIATLHRLRRLGEIVPEGDANPYLKRPRKMWFSRAEVDRFKQVRNQEAEARKRRD